MQDTECIRPPSAAVSTSTVAERSIEWLVSWRYVGSKHFHAAELSVTHNVMELATTGHGVLDGAVDDVRQRRKPEAT